jgi:hypothetical protein
MPRRWVWGPAAILPLALALTACTAPPGHPPIARIALDPGAIPAFDNFQTAVTLDGSASADPIDDPDGSAPLTYAWQVLDTEGRFDTGSDTASAPVVRFLGDRPPTIVLTVTDVDGQSSSATAHLQLTVR